MTETRNLGGRETLKAEFTDADGAPADPTTITLTIRTPDDEVATKTNVDLTNLAVGTWTYPFLYAQAGWHFFKFDGDGAVEAAIEFERYVLRSNVA